MATAELQSSLAKFVTFTRSLKGDEKSEAQIFLDHFFRALGHGGVQEAGATLEFRIAKKPGSAQLELLKGESAVKAKGGKKFADLLWPERVLIEMKSRKENLEKHYHQAFEYWTHIVPKRQLYVIGCRHLSRSLPQDRPPLADYVEKLAASYDFLGGTFSQPISDFERIIFMSTSTNIHHTGIGKILETRALAVPINQRSYSWTDREIDDLWTDLKWAIDEGEKEYFLGTIVLTLPQDSRPLVVDGQQRLASVSMIYAAMRDYLLNLGEGEIAKDIEPFLTNTERWTRTQTAKLELSAQDGLFFQNHVLGAPDSDDRKAAVISKTSPDSHKRIAKAFKKLSDALSELLQGAPEPLKILKRWDTFLQNSAKLIVLEVDDESSAFQVFETLNDRGLDLAVTDLLKNYLFGKAGKQHLDSVRHHWLTALSRIGDGDERVFKRFVHHFWSSMHGLTRERLLYKSIKEGVKTPNRALTFASELASSVSNYAAILNSDADFWTPMGMAAKRAVSTLKDLKLEQYKPLLLACMDTMDVTRPMELAKVLHALVSWSVRFRITQQLGSSKLEDFYGNGGKLVRDKGFRTAAEIIEALKAKVPSDSVFRKAFEEFREESGRLARYYLLEIEQVARTQNGIAEIVNPDEQVNDLEHILPKEPDLAEWPAFSADSAPVYVFRLGNQTVLSKTDNHKLGNAPFAVKRPVFANSDALITKQVASVTDWTDTTIDEHQKWLANLAPLAWPIGG